MLTIQSNLKIHDLETLSKVIIKADIINFSLNKVGGGFTDTITDKIIAKLTLSKDKTIVIINDITLQMTEKLLEAGYTNIYLAFGKWNKDGTISSDATVYNIMKAFVKHNIKEDLNVITLKEIFNMKIDGIIANPPYDNDLHLKITNVVINTCLKDDVEYISIQPARWLQDPLGEVKQNSDIKKYNNVASHIDALEIIPPEAATELFGGEGNIQIAMDLGIYTYKSKPVSKLSVAKQDLIFDKLFNTNTMNGFTFSTGKYKDNKNANFVCLTTFTGCLKRSQPAILCSNKYGAFINGKNAENKTFNEAKESNGHFTNGNIDEQLLALFNSGNEANNFNLSINTKFWKYVCFRSTVTNLVPLKYLPWMPTYKKAWTDTDYCEYFNITQVEWQSMLEEINKVEALWN
jgi:hypothetical protein